MLVHPASHKMAHYEPSTLTFWSTRHSGKMLRELEFRLGILSLSFQAIMLCVLDGRISWHVLQCWKRSQKLEQGKRVTRHIHFFIASRRQDKQQKLGGIASFWASLRWRRIFASLYFYDRYIGIDNVWILSQRYQSYSLLSDFFKYETPLRIWY